MFSFLRSKLRSDDMVHPANNRSYLKHKISARVENHPAMLGKEERILPSYLAKQIANNKGSIVELGCYLGGSTICLLDGLEQAGALDNAREPLVHSYDLFLANDYMIDHTLRSFGIANGDSFEPVFRELLGDRAHHITTHAGDIREQRWTGGPIKLLYVDILWSWETNQHVFDQFYRALVPGSCLIHQDFVYSSYPWLPITMEWLVSEGYFSFNHFAEHSTVAFRCERSLRDIPLVFRIEDEIPEEKKLELLRKSAARFHGYPAALLRLSEAVYLLRTGDREAAVSVIEEVESNHDHEYARYHLRIAKDLLKTPCV